MDGADAPHGPPITILHLTGEIDLRTRARARSALEAALRTTTDPGTPDAGTGASASGLAPGGLVIDVAGLGFCDAGGFTLLAETARAAADSGVAYALAGASPHLQRVAALLACEDQVPSYPSITVAFASYTADTMPSASPL